MNKVNGWSCSLCLSSWSNRSLTIPHSLLPSLSIPHVIAAWLQSEERKSERRERDGYESEIAVYSLPQLPMNASSGTSIHFLQFPSHPFTSSGFPNPKMKRDDRKGKGWNVDERGFTRQRFPSLPLYLFLSLPSPTSIPRPHLEMKKAGKGMDGGISRLFILEIGKRPSYCRYSGLKELVYPFLFLPSYALYRLEVDRRERKG